MAEKVDLVKTIRGSNTYVKVIDPDFTELVSNVVEEPIVSPTVEDFFELYDTLFFDIPPTGDTNSHAALIERSTAYVGGSVNDPEKQALIEEINALRQQLLDIGETFAITNNLTQ